MKADGYPDVDPWVVDWFDQLGEMMDPPAEGYTAEYLAAARPSEPVFPVTVEIAQVTRDTVAGVPAWIYEHDQPATGVVVYAHGGGMITGSPALMDPIAREIAAASGATVISIDWRLAPEHPFPAGLDDFVAVTDWVIAHARERFGVAPTQVAVAGESGGGNLSAALALRFRDEGSPPLAGQVLLYPVVDNPHTDTDYPSRRIYEGLVITRDYVSTVWGMYSGDQDIDEHPYASPIRAADLAGVAPAFVMVGGCDWLRDEGLAYADRLAAAGVPTEVLNCAGQPHAFINLQFPAAADVYAALGPWLRTRFADAA